MVFGLIYAVLKDAGALDAVESYLVSALAAAQIKPRNGNLPSGDRAKDVERALKSHFMQSEHLSLAQRRMLGAGWQQGLSAPRNGKVFWSYSSEGVVKARWSSLAKGYVIAGASALQAVEPILWLPLSAFPEDWAPPK